MHHDTPLLALVAVGLVLACAFGYLDLARQANPTIDTVVRTHSDYERELANGMTAYALDRLEARA